MVMLTTDAAGISANASRLLSEMRGATHTPGGGSPYA